MIALRGFTISIGYAPILKITLVANMRHFKEQLVITSPDDDETQAVARSVAGVELFVTDAATAHGAYFNKGLCFEKAWDHWGRHGWFAIWDADILLPEHIPLDWLKPEKLYGCRRRILADPSRYRPDLVWATCPIHHDGGPVGYFQVFNSEASDIRDKRPWYDVSFSHAGGGDEFFMHQFSPQNRSILSIDCLHLGKPATNWFGVSGDKRNMMAKFITHYHWMRGARQNRGSLDDPTGWKDGEIVERVEPPGYQPSTHEIAFVKRWKQVHGR